MGPGLASAQLTGSSLQDALLEEDFPDTQSILAVK